MLHHFQIGRRRPYYSTFLEFEIIISKPDQISDVHNIFNDGTFISSITFNAQIKSVGFVSKESHWLTSRLELHLGNAQALHEFDSRLVWPLAF